MTDIIVKDIKNGSEYYYNNSENHYISADVPYDNTTSGLISTNVQDAIDEVYWIIFSPTVTWVAHIPSQQEFADLKSITDGLSLTAWNDYKEKLHMPFVGYRDLSNTSLYSQGSSGYYLSSSPHGSDPSTALNLFLSSYVNADSNVLRSVGASVRLFLDEYIEPDNTRTVEAWTLWDAWIFHNTDLWVISVTNWTDKSITMYDKNVWATVVYNNWDTLTETNMGKMFQWWNYYWFPSTWTISKTSSTQVDTTWYWWTNPYSSDTFITWNYDRSNPSNNNLRTDSKEEYFVIE